MSEKQTVMYGGRPACITISTLDQVKPTSMDSEAELVDLRTKLLEAEASMKRASVENDELSAKLARLVEEQRQQEAAKVSKKEDCVDEIRQRLQREYDEKFETEFRNWIATHFLCLEKIELCWYKYVGDRHIFALVDKNTDNR